MSSTRAPCARGACLLTSTGSTCSGQGTIYSYTVVHRAPPGFADAPYVVALVELAEGPRMMTRVIDVEPGSVEIGQKVELEIRGEPPLPYFRLAG